MENTNNKRAVFFVSDGTGITATTVGHSLLTQFDDLETEQVTLPYVTTPERAAQAVERINAYTASNGQRPIVIGSLVNPSIRHQVASANAFFLDLFGTFIEPLEYELQRKSSHTIGRSHSMNNTRYNTRIDAVNFALQHDDGSSAKTYERAEVILIGVSRSGKTPTSLYLAMQFSCFVANYPLAEDDIEGNQLPLSLRPYKHKLFGLTISAERLQQIRQGRRPNSRYASLVQCQMEIQRVEALYRKLEIPYVDTTHHSVEEIAAMILEERKLARSF